MKTLKKIVVRTLLVLAAVFVALFAYVKWYVDYGPDIPAALPNTIRIACIGDSITEKVPFFAERRYPERLGDRLGAGYSVRNFAAIAYTAQKDGDKSYWSHRYFQLSSEFAPNVVLIMLGTNDTKPQNWAGPERFERDYRALIQHYRSLDSKPRVILMTPPSTFLVKGHKELPSKMNAEHVATITTMLKRIGGELGLTVIDIHAITAPHPEFFELDGVHPDSNGDQLIADAVYAELNKAAVPAN